jgi:hypothetical protein
MKESTQKLTYKASKEGKEQNESDFNLLKDAVKELANNIKQKNEQFNKDRLPNPITPAPEDQIKLKFQNGEVLSVGRHTLTKYSEFANSFSHLSAEGSHLVDRDPEAFKFLLNYIRSDKKIGE